MSADQEPEEWLFTVPSNTLPEIKAMAVIAGLAERLDAYEVARVLGWAVTRFGPDNSGSTSETA